MSIKSMGGKPANALVGLLLAAVVIATLALGSWWGFPVQDDTYLIRLMRMGGAARLAHDHPDRPIPGFLIAQSAALAGEHRPPYIAASLISWLLFAALAAAFWRRLFPEWESAWPAVALAVVAPVLTMVQFTTVTTLFQCLLPVGLVFGALVLLIGAPDASPGPLRRVAALLLAGAGACVSEYGLATAIACATFLLMRGRWRALATVAAGSLAGYAVFRAVSDVHLRVATNPEVQARLFLSRPWVHPLRVLTAAWYCVGGAWAGAASRMRLEWSAKSTLIAAGLALLVAAAGARLGAGRREGAEENSPAGRLGSLLAAVVAGLIPAVVIQGWPLRLVYESRFLLPVAVFASCATVGMLMAFGRPAFRTAIVFLLCFVAADSLVNGAFEERRLQQKFQALGERLLPFVQSTDGLVALVTPDQTGQSAEEVLVKATYRWDPAEANRLWILRPSYAETQYPARAACPEPRTLRLPRSYLRWPHTEDPIAMVLWDPGDREWLPPAAASPYFFGCAAR